MAELQGGQKVRVLLAQALFGHPAGAAARRADQPPRPRLDPLAARVPRPLRRHAHRHLARSALPERGLHAHRGHRLPDDHHLHRRLRRHGDGQDADPVARSRRENAQRDKKIAQLNDFIARFSAGTRSSQVQSRRKEVERLQTTELARSNIQRPYIKFAMARPSGKVVAGVHGRLEGATATSKVVVELQRRSSIAARRSCSSAATASGKTTLLKALLADAPGLPAVAGRTSTPARCAGATKCRSATSRRITPGAIQKGMTAVDWLHQFDPGRVAPGHSRPARPDAVQRRRRPEADRGALGRRDGAAALLPHHAAEAERAGARRADEPPRPRSRSTR